MAAGQNILVAWPGTEGTADNDDSLSLAVVPIGMRGPVRLFHLPDVSDAASMLAFPLCVAGNHLFLQGGSNMVVRLDLATGKVTRHACEKQITLYAAISFLLPRLPLPGGAQAANDVAHPGAHDAFLSRRLRTRAFPRPRRGRHGVPSLV